MHEFDAIVIGAGAAGLFCAGIAGQRGLKVLLVDHADKVAEKIRISGGGRCNFTNRDLDPRAPHKHFLGANPHFCRSALARYTPQDFIALVGKHGIAFHEKHKGQLFGDHSSDDFIRMLLAECGAGGVTHWQPCKVQEIGLGSGRYELRTDRGPVSARSVVIATGGLSIPKIGATDFGYRIAQQFGVKVVPTRPGLVPLTFDGSQWEPFAQLAGLALPVVIETALRPAQGSRSERMHFHEDLLFTHRGLSGPAVLQISSFWRPGDAVEINLLPEHDALEWLQGQQAARPNSELKTLLGEVFTKKMANLLADRWFASKPMKQYTPAELREIAQRLGSWQVVPAGTEGYRTAEVTLGGVDTREVSPKTFESRKSPGLYFIGEVLDVTGHLGGFNFQWAWASGHAAAQVV